MARPRGDARLHRARRSLAPDRHANGARSRALPVDGSRRRGDLADDADERRRRLCGAGVAARPICRRGGLRRSRSRSGSRDGCGNRSLSGRRRGRSRRRRCRRSRGCRRSDRCRCGRRRRRRDRSRRRGRARRQEAERVDIALVLRGDPDTEVDVGLRQLGVATRPDGADDSPLRERSTLLDRDRAEVRERDGIAVERRDRDALAGRRNGAGEGDDARRGREDRRPCLAADVDAAVLPGRVRVRGVERERLQHRAVDRPRPRLRGGHENECGERRREKDAQCASPPWSSRGTSVRR